jgi:hypothetical protein
MKKQAVSHLQTSEHAPQEVATLIRIPGIENQAQLQFALMLTRKYFSDANWLQPPIPDNVISFVPCELLITETTNDQRKMTGRIQFLRNDGTSCFDKEWSIK